ncbi:MAG: hypothetical protein JWN78_2941 [Bacteroidota bacterium]|nr:hypothetical protein [Bacteroidota bacterium]
MKKNLLIIALICIGAISILPLTSCKKTTTNTVTQFDTVINNVHDTIKCLDSCFDAVACYSFDGNANDRSGNGFNGTVVNATLTADRRGKPNSAYLFSQASGSYIELPTYASILGTSDDFSVSMWLKFSGVDAGPTPLGLYPDNTSDRLLISVPYHPTASPADIFFDYGNSSGGRLNVKITTFTNWKHFVFVRNKTAGLMQIYVNGVLVGSKSANVDITNKNRNFRIGSGGPGTETFNGVIDEVKIFDRALTQADVDKLLIN